MAAGESSSTAAAAAKLGTMSEQDVSTILQRYPPDTVLILLHELANLTATGTGTGTDIDWTAIANKTNAKVFNPKEPDAQPLRASELKRLWRHLAYREPLIKAGGGGDEEEDDEEDSDLEFEVEASPSVNVDAPIFKEAVNCVHKLAFGTLPANNESNHVNKKSKDKIVHK